MGYYNNNSKNRLQKQSRANGVRDRILNNTTMQKVILVTYSILIILYNLWFTANISNNYFILKSNTDLLNSDMTLTEVISIDTLDNGDVRYKLEDGGIKRSSSVEFVFVEDNNEDLAYYSAIDNKIVMEVGDDYLFNIINGTKYFYILGLNLILVTILILNRRYNKLAHLGTKKGIMTIGILNIILIFSGLLSWVLLG